jgi:prepilin-type N-terminal cleavage/methylation domain-containing protein
VIRSPSLLHNGGDAFSRSPPLRFWSMVMRHTSRGFTLIELLVVVGVMALLIGILLPSLARARVTAKIVKARADLHNITVALTIYRQDNGRQLPPTRFSCSSRTEYELPMELALGNYLPSETKSFGIVVKMRDVFNPDTTYKYRAAGPAIINESTLLINGSALWVPSGFPNCDGTTGQYYSNANDTPVRYALWSAGPPVRSDRADPVPGHAPIPSSFWCRGAGDGGVITIFEDQKGCYYSNP